MTVKNNYYIINLEKEELIKTSLLPQKIGFEIEFKTPTPTKTVCQQLGLEENKGGKIRKEYKINNLIISEEIDLFKEESLFAYCYHDGSVGAEIVTTAFNEDEVYINLKKSYEIIKTVSEKPDFFAEGKAGQHMTFINGEHRDTSFYSSALAHNVLRFCNIFYDTLILLSINGDEKKVKATRRNRDETYLPENPLRETLQNMRKKKNSIIITRGLYFRQPRVQYQIVRLKYENSKIWGLEFRYPDGTDNAESMDYLTRLNNAIITSMNNLVNSNFKLFIKKEHNKKIRKLFYDKLSANSDINSKKVFYEQIKDYITKNKARLEEQNELLLFLIEKELKEKGIYKKTKELLDFKTRFKTAKKSVLRNNLNKNTYFNDVQREIKTYFESKRDMIIKKWGKPVCINLGEPNKIPKDSSGKKAKEQTETITIDEPTRMNSAIRYSYNTEDGTVRPTPTGDLTMEEQTEEGF